MGGCCGGFGWVPWGHWGGNLGLIGPVLSLAWGLGWLALLVLGIVWVVRTLRRRPPGISPDAGIEPLEIARRRLAMGEITPEEFEAIREQIGT